MQSLYERARIGTREFHMKKEEEKKESCLAYFRKHLPIERIEKEILDASRAGYSQVNLSIGTEVTTIKEDFKKYMWMYFNSIKILDKFSVSIGERDKYCETWTITVSWE